MNDNTIDILNNFTINNLPDLDVVVLGALELFQKETLPSIDMSLYKRPLVVGSGNAEVTGRIMFRNVDAIFASESTYEHALATMEAIDGVVVISASGGKHAPIITRHAKELGKHVTLITNNPHSEASSLLSFSNGDTQYVFPKNREPYTYNTSSYMGMILASTKEDPARIMQFIKESIDTLDLSMFATYDKYYVIVPTKFSSIVRMIQIKFVELFGRTIARDVETSEYVKHATTVVPSQELFLSFGDMNTSWGNEGSRVHIPVPEWADYGTMMAISYYVVGKLQKQHPAYFKENIVQYTEEISKVFGENISPIVD